MTSKRTNSNTPHSRRLRAETASAWNAAREAEGWRRITILLPPAESEMLDRLAEIHGSKKAAIAAAIRAVMLQPCRTNQ